MNDYTIIGEYYPEGDTVVRIDDEGKKVVAEGFIAFCILSTKKPRFYYQEMFSLKKEKELFKLFLKDTDFLMFLGKKRVKSIKRSFLKFRIYAGLRLFFNA